MNRNAKPYQRLAGAELRLYNRYARIKDRIAKHDPYAILQTVQVSSSGNTARGVPLIVAGAYVP